MVEWLVKEWSMWATVQTTRIIFGSMPKQIVATRH